MSHSLAIGIDVGGTAIKALRLESSTIAESQTVATPRERVAFVLALESLSRDLTGGYSLATPVGIALPGFLDETRRRIVHLSNLPFLDGFELASALEERGLVSVTLDTDTNAGGVGESLLGAGREAERVLYIALGTGLGGALVERGRPVRVRNHTVGQIAHVPLRHGPAESLLCERGIVHRAGEEFPTARELAVGADEGAPRALAAWKETGEMLGELLALLAPLWQPEIAIIGGGIALASRHFLPDATRRFRELSSLPAVREMPIVPAVLGLHAGAAGAARLARDAVDR